MSIAAYQMVQKLKENDEDFEWYPTTPAIIQMVKSRCKESDSVLDCGAGDGRVLQEITKGTKYAIEKAIPLIQAMPADIVIIGTEFFQSTLIDKPVDVVFCNPPYSEYETWAVKIINEAHALKVFLVIPERWKDSSAIQQALKKRGVAAEVIGSFDFLHAERAARAKVNVLQIRLSTDDRYSYRDTPDDPFEAWFDSEFEFQKNDNNVKAGSSESLKDRLNKALVTGKGKVPALVELYNHEMEYLYETFTQISRLDADLLKELGTGKNAIAEALKLRIKGLKNKYWEELFSNLDDITNRLTSASRKKMLEKLTAQTNVDFTESNIYGVLIWVIKNANHYYNQQLIDIVEGMVEEANIIKYKSNLKTYQFSKWRYREDRDSISHYGLELRIVLNRSYAVNTSSWDGWSYPENLRDTAHDFLNDLVTIAHNLNFDIPATENSHQKGGWVSGQTKEFYTKDGKILMAVRAFKNGNIHVKFNQAFIRRLNVEFGRLKGWLRDENQAADELNIPVAEAKTCFTSNRQIVYNNIKLLTI